MTNRFALRSLSMCAAILSSAPLLAADTQPASQPAARTTPPTVGEKAPELSLQTLDGKTISLADSLKDGPVVIVELRGWVGYQCPICNRQVGELVAHSKTILAKAARVLFIYPGPADGLKAHAEEFITGKGMPDNYLFLLDPGNTFVTSWGLRWNKAGETAFPSTFVVDKDGIIQYAKVSSSHGNRASSADILKALGDLK